MPYIINKSNGSVLVTLADAILDTTTSLGLLGRNYTSYGEVQNENFVFLLENFANANPPARPISGQLWFDTTKSILNVYNGTIWIPVGAAISQDTEPTSVIGSFWLKDSTNQLFMFTDTGWELVGPQGVEGFGKTRAESTILKDTSLVDHAVIIFYVNGLVQAIVANEPFTIHPTNSVVGFQDLLNGVNIASLSYVQGELSGNASSATKLKTARTINGIPFDGTQNITLLSSTTNSLVAGAYITGARFNGSGEVIWNINGSSESVPNTLVARNESGSFLTEEITAVRINSTLFGNVNSVTGTSSIARLLCPTIEGDTYSGLANRASKLSPGRTINGVYFDATADIIVTAAANTLTSDTLNSTVINSSLRTLGTLDRLSVNTDGITIGVSNKLYINIVDNFPNVLADTKLKLIVSENGPNLSFVGPTEALAQGGPASPAILSNNSINIGGPTKKFDRVYANLFLGNALSATKLETARTINGVAFDGTQNIVIADNTKLPLIGGTITGSMQVNGKITLPQAPTVGTDAVNKTYVDTLVASKPLFFSLDTRGLDLTMGGAGSVVSILNVLAPPAGIIAGTICRVSSSVQSVTTSYSAPTASRIAFRYVTSVSVSTTVNDPLRRNTLVYRVNSNRTSWEYVSG